MIDSFERAFAENLCGVIVVFHITVSCSSLLFEIAVFDSYVYLVFYVLLYILLFCIDFG